MKVLWILFPEMTLCDVPKIEIFNFVWILFPDMTLGDLPGFWILFPGFTDKGSYYNRIFRFSLEDRLLLSDSYSLAQKIVYFRRAPQSDAMESEIFVFNTAESLLSQY